MAPEFPARRAAAHAEVEYAGAGGELTTIKAVHHGKGWVIRGRDVGEDELLERHGFKVMGGTQAETETANEDEAPAPETTTETAGAAGQEE